MNSSHNFATENQPSTLQPNNEEAWNTDPEFIYDYGNQNFEYISNKDSKQRGV